MIANESTVQSLRNVGLSLLNIQTSSHIPSNAFSSAQQTLHNLRDIPVISHDADSAHVTGYHPAGGSMSRYNLFREGFVWSDEGIMETQMDSEFSVATRQLEDLLHSVAQCVLQSIEQHLLLPVGWFEENFGSMRNHSQWHLKRFVETTDPDQKESHWLPAHTDPSLISIVIHDRRDTQDGGYGLEYKDASASSASKWIPVQKTGHAVAIVMVGSVLSQITGGLFPACRHRVLQQPGERMAATLFLRPAPLARLQVPPSPLLQHVAWKHPFNMTFDQWSSRVARNYQNGKSKKTNQNKEKNISQSAPETDLDHFKDEHTDMALLSCNPPLRGAEKYLGGELGQNGKIYAIPGHATRVLCIDPTEEPPILTLIGPEFHGKYKWLRSVQFQSGIIIGIPCHASCLLRIDPRTESISTIEWDPTDPLAPDPSMKWKWHGGQISPVDGCLYCVPQRAETVLKFDPLTERVSFLGGPFPGRNKWYGGLLGIDDGAIYAIHQCHSSVLKIDPSDQTCSLHGDFPSGGYKWHGAVVAPTGAIYGIPSHGTFLLLCELEVQHAQYHPHE